MPAARKIVLFLPPHAGRVFGPPISLLALASPLRQAGFEVRLIDGVLYPNYCQTIEQELKSALCVGISLLTGPAIRHAIAAAQHVKRLNPTMPVIFGGWHPSLMPGQTLREEYVDIVTRYQGERTLLEIAQRLAAGKSLDLVEGCWFKRYGNIQQNADRHTEPMSALPPPAYDLANLDAYEALTGERTFPYASSVGCPYACNYCTDQIFYGRRVNAYSAEHAADEMTKLSRLYRVDRMALVDSNFLVDTRRASALAERLITNHVTFQWSFQASTDLLCRMSDEEVQTLAASGVNHIGFGTEAASEAVLRKMNKPHQRIPDLYEAARKCKQAGIPVTYNLIFGYPGETSQHRQETMRVMTDITDKFDNVSFSPNVFTPYPGIPIWPELRELGLKEPQSLAEWAEFDLGGAPLPWLEDDDSLRKGIAYFVLDSEVSKATRNARKSKLRRGLLTIFRKPLTWRVHHQTFQFPFELWWANARRWLVLRRSLLTGRPIFSGVRRV
jgi:radical SAM superfamily enzyme YgiQ (UPF0313 family)